VAKFWGEGRSKGRRGKGTGGEGGRMLMLGGVGLGGVLPKLLSIGKLKKRGPRERGEEL